VTAPPAEPHAGGAVSDRVAVPVARTDLQPARLETTRPPTTQEHF